MKKLTLVLLTLAVMLSFAACGEKPGEVVIENAPAPVVTDAPAVPAPAPAPASAPEVTPVPLVPELPPVWDETLNAVLDRITDDVRPGSAGASLRAVSCGADLLDWAYGSELSDDEIYSAVGCWMDTLDDSRLKSFFDAVLNVYDSCYDLKTDRAADLMDSAGVSSGYYPWNDSCFHKVEMVSYACGAR